MELHEKELFELQRIKEEEEKKKRELVEKSVNSVLDLLERKKEELENKENVLQELRLIHGNERKALEEEMAEQQRQLAERHTSEAEQVVGQRGELRAELEVLEQQLEELVAQQAEQTDQTDGPADQARFPCPECPVCLELLLPPTRIMQCSNGHLVCRECEAKSELTSCPTCRQTFTGRATAMEQHLATLFT